MASSRRKLLPKLVRDKIPELIMRSGKRPERIERSLHQEIVEV
jgi:predicted house-cleaning noncanonical NTP pyrophosphatase (MazG superfamily)